MQSVKSLYLHFPFCRHKCHYCDFYKKVPESESEFREFEESLKKSWEKHDRFMDEQGYVWGDLETLYIGGGTPSLWKEKGAVFFQRFLQERGLVLGSGCEFTMEVNPGDWTSPSFEAWSSLGVNRYSLGIQALDDFFLKTLDRIHSLNAVYHSLDFLASQGYDFSVDFMLGLPFSKERQRNILEELKRALEYSPVHLSLYILTLKKGHFLFNRLADEVFVEQEYLGVSDYLKERGYLHYEVSNFAQSGKMSRHNLKYWEMQTVAALGPSGTGFLAEQRLRYKWNSQGNEYELEQLAPSALKLEQFYSFLRTFRGVDPKSFFEGENLQKAYALLNDWVLQGRGRFEEGHFVLTGRGFLLMDGLIDECFSRGLL